MYRLIHQDLPAEKGAIPSPRDDMITPSVLPWSTRLLYLGAQVFAHFLLPFLAVALLLRARKEPGHLHHLSHRFGFGPVGPHGAVWVFAASLGETRAASPLIRRLRAEGHAVLLTHQSPAGLAEGWRLFPEDPGITHRFVPIDLFWIIRLFLARARPAVLVVLEIELWPAMLIETVGCRVPVIMANGNLLERSMGKGGGIRGHLMSLYRLFTVIFTRTDAYRDRYLSLGLTPERVQVVGEMKYDQWIDPAHPPMGQALRDRWEGAQRVLMIASSVRAEEPALLALAVRRLAADPGLRLVWVPRSPQRFDAVAAALSAAGISVVLRSALGAEMKGEMPNVQVLVGDSTGEMNVFYSIADLVFVGASLVDLGGHNIMEPMALGRPVVMGPSTYGIAFAAEPAAAAGALETLPDAASLETRIAALLDNPGQLRNMSTAAATFAAAQSGAAARTLAGLTSVLGKDLP